MPGHQSDDNRPRTRDANKEGYPRTSIARASPLFPIVDDRSTLDTPPDIHIPSGWWLLLTVAMAGLSIVPVWAADDWQPSSYEDRFVNPTNGVHLKDNNVWVYKRAFAERFGMPERWINEELDGAEAVAYRVEWSNMQQCGFFGESENCRPIERCLLDVYLNDSQSQHLPWKTSETQDFIRYQSSTRFLTAQRRQDAPSWNPEERKWDVSRANIGLDSLSWVSGPPRGGKVYSASSSAVSVLAYDRRVFEGLDYIKLVADCNIAARKHNVRILFQKTFPDRDDYDVSYRELVEKKTDRAIEFLEYKQAWFRSKFKGAVPHIVHLPDHYMVRVQEYDRREYRPKSLATEVERRLRKQDDDDPNTKHWWQRLFGL